MIIEALSLLAFGWLFDRVASYDAVTGYRCNLCSWKYNGGSAFTYSPAAREKAKQLFELHMIDAHPRVAEEEAKLR